MTSQALQSFITSRAEFCEPRTFRNHQLYWDARRNFLGASEVSVLFAKEGWSAPWMSEYSVALEKREGLRAGESDEWMEVATDMEAVIAQRYANRLGPDWIVERPGKAKQLFISNTCPPLACTPDAFVLPADSEQARLMTFLGEFKAPRFGMVWRELPNYYRIQAMVQMLVMGVRRCVVVALFPGIGIREFPVDFDAALGAEIAIRARHFWDHYVVGGETPPIDGSDATTDALKLKYPKAEIDMLTLDETAVPIFEEYAALKADADAKKTVYDAADEELSAAKNRIREIMGNAGAAQVLVDGKTIAKVSNREVKETPVSFVRAAYRNLRITLINKD